MAFKRCSIGTKCAKKIPPTPLHHHHQPEPLRQGRMIHAFMFFTPNSDPTIWMSQQKSRLIRPGNVFSNLILSNSVDPVWIVSSVSCSYLTGAAPGVVFCCCNPSASGFDVLCVQRCILQTLVVTSDYLSDYLYITFYHLYPVWNTQTSPSGTNNQSLFRVS